MSKGHESIIVVFLMYNHFCQISVCLNKKGGRMEYTGAGREEGSHLVRRHLSLTPTHGTHNTNKPSVSRGMLNGFYMTLPPLKAL